MKINFCDDEKFQKFKEILEKFNQIHSLTTYSGEKIDENIKDSLDGLEFIQKYPKIAIDVGSGAGFPAIFLAMALPLCEWNLFEPNPKKSAFLRYAKVNLGLKNITIFSEKIENSSKFIANLITSRALGELKFIAKICDGFYDENSEILLYKGSRAKAEISDFKNVQIFQKNGRNYIYLKGLSWEN